MLYTHQAIFLVGLSILLPKGYCKNPCPFMGCTVVILELQFNLSNYAIKNDCANLFTIFCNLSSLQNGLSSLLVKVSPTLANLLSYMSKEESTCTAYLKGTSTKLRRPMCLWSLWPTSHLLCLSYLDQEFAIRCIHFPFSHCSCMPTNHGKPFDYTTLVNIF